MNHLSKFVAVLLVTSGWQAAAAEDAVYLKPHTAGGPLVRVRGEIVEYTGRELRIQNAAGRERTIPADQIERFETSHSAEELAGDEKFAAGDFRGALDSYNAALQAAREPRDWVRRRILARVIWCQRNLGHWQQAGEYFLILAAADPATPDFDAVPLVWIDDPPPADLQRTAATWLADAERPIAVLMGASLLLATDKRPEALDKLRGLLSTPDARIAWLAFAQLWRAGSNNATDQQRQQFARRIDESDASLRAGPYFVLGRSLARTNPEDAAIALMRVPIQYERERELAAAALVEAAQLLEQLGRANRALPLYREAASRFAESAAAGQARQHLERLAPADGARDNES